MAYQNAQLPGENPLLNRFFLSPQEKKDWERGKQMVKQFYYQQTTNDGLSFFKQRNARQIEILLWAKGSQNMKEFLDYLSVSDANKSFVNIDMTQQRVAAQFLNTIVESMAKNEFYPCVYAVDDGSINEKENREIEAIYRMKEVETIKDIQKQSGLQFEPDNVYIPDDELSAKVYYKIQDRLPKEIRFEEYLKRVAEKIKFGRILSRKGLYDLASLNFEATKIERSLDGDYTVRKCIPTNCIYNFFMNDSGDYEITMFGEFYNIKVKDYRKKYGKSPTNPNGLTEEQIFNLAKLSTTKTLGKFNFMWDNQWANTTFMHTRPYDDFSILVLDCMINCGENVYYVSKKDAYGKEDIQRKNGVPYAPQIKKDGTVVQQQKPDDVEIIESQRTTWMNGVYAPYGDTLLYWGEPDVIISDYTDTNRSLCPYSVNIPGNDGEYVPSLFERALEPLREYTMVKLKRKQIISKLKPTGIRIDVESARNIDLGSGDSIPWEEVVKIYDQTGNELWSSKGIDPLERTAPPLSNTVQNDDIQKIIGLTNIMEGILNEIRMLLGSSVYLEGGDLGDRTAATLAENQIEQASNVFGYVMNGHLQVWEETYYKLCLLKWKDIVTQEPESKDDLLNTRFNVSVKMKLSDYEKQQLESDINRFSQMPDAQGNPSITPVDAFMLRQIDDNKLATWYLAKTWQENRKNAIQESQQLQQQNAQIQQQSAAQAAQQALEAQQQKIQDEKDMLDYRYTKEKELAFINVIGQVAAKGGFDPKIFMPVINQLIPNLSIPLSEENKDMVNGVQAKEMADAMQQNEMAQQNNGGQNQPAQGQMPMNMMQQSNQQPVMQNQ